MGSSKFKGSCGSASRHQQRFGGGSSTPLEAFKNSPKKVSKAQITKLKSQQEAFQSNRAFWEGKGPPELVGDASDEEDVFRMADILEGNATMDNSHAGDWEDIAGTRWTTDAGSRKYRDYRTRRDRTERRNQRFSTQREPMVEAYMVWYGALGQDGLGGGVPGDFEGEINAQTVITVDIFRSYYSLIQSCEQDNYWSCSLVRNGLFPCSPGISTVGITTRTLEIFRIQSLRCPRLSIKAFVKSLCDLQGVPFKPYLQVQFSIAFDLYLDVLARVYGHVKVALGRDSPNWRLANACPACLYKVEGQTPMEFQLLATQDGNNSLKRMRRAERVEGTDGPAVGKSKEATDTREAGGDYFLSREEVNLWSKESIKEMAGGEVEEVEVNPCEERWKNLSEELTVKMWGVYEETGVFLSLCRHSFVLLITDMVASGELAKYPLSILNRLLDVVGEGIAMGYDIGCGYSTTVNRSPLGEKARRLRFLSLVGAFHGHAHGRLCQLCHLATYKRGVGINHLEQCEPFFSESNKLASTVRYCYHHDNFEAYSCLSKFLVNNYKQALEIQNTRHALAKTMVDLGIPSTATFNLWLKEEKEYLQGLKKEPLEETLQMGYYKTLEKLEAAEERLSSTDRQWFLYTPNNASQAFVGQDESHLLETQRRHAFEKRDDLKTEVQALELRMGIKGADERWKRGSEEWEKAKGLVTMSTYQRALDKLEGLIVARLFELTKLNMSRTGYKLRQHIANALKSRSQAIRTAVAAYNEAASKVNCPELTWEQVVEYSFLSDFKLLRDARRDVRSERWAQPAGRLALDQYNKLLGAEEEIQRLNNEILALVTYIHEETAYIRLQVEGLRRTDPLLAIQVEKYGWERGRCNSMHILKLKKLEKIAGFTGSLLPTRSPLYPLIHVATAMDTLPSTLNDRDDDQDAPPADEDPNEEDNELIELATILEISTD